MSSAYRVSDIEIGLVASGLFVPSNQPVSFEVANPYAPRHPELTTLQASFDSLVAQSPDVRFLSSAAIDSYGEAVAQVAIALSASQPDLVLVPCRGGLKPWRQVEAMCLHKLNGLLFLSTGLGTGKGSQEVKSVLHPPLAALNRESLSIGILDTADGGQGSVALAQLLKQIWNDLDRPNWAVQFHLLARRDSPVGEAGSRTLALTEQCFACWSSVYPVDDLLVEDWDPAFGIRFDDPDRTIMKPLCGTRDRIGVIRGDATYVYASDAPYDTINQLIARSASEAIVTTPWLVQTSDLTQQ